MKLILTQYNHFDEFDPNHKIITIEPAGIMCFLDESFNCGFSNFQLFSVERRKFFHYGGCIRIIEFNTMIMKNYFANGLIET